MKWKLYLNKGVIRKQNNKGKYIKFSILIKLKYRQWHIPRG